MHQGNRYLETDPWLIFNPFPLRLSCSTGIESTNNGLRIGQQACRKMDEVEGKTNWHQLDIKRFLRQNLFSCYRPCFLAMEWRHLVDIVDRQTRSRMMSGIRAKDTRPELALRRALHVRGLRYRLHVKDIPGRPDLVFPKHRAVILVHGCFWHRHQGCRYTTTPSTRPNFWQAKFETNMARDRAVCAALRKARWRIATVWECALRKTANVEVTADLLAIWLQGNGNKISSKYDDLIIDEERISAANS